MGRVLIVRVNVGLCKISNLAIMKPSIHEQQLFQALKMDCHHHKLNGMDFLNILSIQNHNFDYNLFLYMNYFY